MIWRSDEQGFFVGPSRKCVRAMLPLINSQNHLQTKVRTCAMNGLLFGNKKTESGIRGEKFLMHTYACHQRCIFRCFRFIAEILSYFVFSLVRIPWWETIVTCIFVLILRHICAHVMVLWGFGGTAFDRCAVIGTEATSILLRHFYKFAEQKVRDTIAWQTVGIW